MPRKQPIRLLRSALTGAVYAVTSYGDLGDGRILARQKYDVTGDFEMLTRQVADIVVRPEVVTYSSGKDPQLTDPDTKARLDELHLRKIDLADEVLILNVGGYIGESTRRELAYAQSLGKSVRFLEDSAR